ncbi:hypothetical protein CsSME_00045198 [Camellia sinensis var. sinensis]
MLGLLQSYFTETRSDPKQKLKKQSKQNYIYRDELDKKSSILPRKLKKRAKEGEATKPLLQKEDGKKNIERENHHGDGGSGSRSGGMKVRVLMTKEEAARLLSKCKDGGVLQFKDVACELIQIPQNRVSVVDSSQTVSPISIPNPVPLFKTNDGVLESIPEEEL